MISDVQLYLYESEETCMCRPYSSIVMKVENFRYHTMHGHMYERLHVSCDVCCQLVLGLL